MGKVNKTRLDLIEVLFLGAFTDLLKLHENVNILEKLSILKKLFCFPDFSQLSFNDQCT